jgi:hypothetical protein
VNDFVPVSGHPGYTINALGQVCSERAGQMILSHDAKGRVSLRNGDGKTVKYYVGELLAAAGFFASGTDKEAVAKAEETAKDALARLALAESRAQEVEDSLRKSRKGNGHLLALMPRLRERISELEAQVKAQSAPKRGRAEQHAEPPMEDW